ncbi:hypothetical protein BH09PSE4_BH09PSE4_10130 [soil metagenome]
MRDLTNAQFVRRLLGGFLIGMAAMFTLVPASAQALVDRVTQDAR